jgi:hypothetical protein
MKRTGPFRADFFIWQLKADNTSEEILARTGSELKINPHLTGTLCPTTGADWVSFSLDSREGMDHEAI